MTATNWVFERLSDQRVHVTVVVRGMECGVRGRFGSPVMRTLIKAAQGMEIPDLELVFRNLDEGEMSAFDRVLGGMVRRLGHRTQSEMNAVRRGANVTVRMSDGGMPYKVSEFLCVEVMDPGLQWLAEHAATVMCPSWIRIQGLAQTREAAYAWGMMTFGLTLEEPVTEVPDSSSVDPLPEGFTQEQVQFLQSKIEDYPQGVSLRLSNCAGNGLDHGGVFKFWWQLLAHDMRVSKPKNFGRRTFAETQDYAEKVGLHVGWKKPLDVSAIRHLLPGDDV